MKIAVLGAAGGIGQPLSLLLKMNLPAGSELALYDPAPMTRGVAVDLSHIPTAVRVKGYTGRDPDAALDGADIVLIPAWIARKPGMERSDLFKFNAGIVMDLVQHCARCCPQALLALITNPVNSMVPVAAEVLKMAGVYDSRRLFGLTTLDVVRAESFCASDERPEALPVKGAVPVVGGHSGTTIVPLYSHLGGDLGGDDALRERIRRVQQAGTDVVEAKAGAGSATLAMAYAALRFCLSLLRARQGELGIIECAYVEGGHPEALFFSQRIRLGIEGIAEVLPYQPLHPVEQAAIDSMLPGLNEEIRQGIDFVRQLMPIWHQVGR